jgi:low affinity Fe/Cu permease
MKEVSIVMRKLSPEEKAALKEKLKEEGLDEERSKPVKITLSDDKKEEMKKMIAQAEQERIERLDKMLHSRKAKKKEED